MKSYESRFGNGESLMNFWCRKAKVSQVGGRYCLYMWWNVSRNVQRWFWCKEESDTVRRFVKKNEKYERKRDRKEKENECSIQFRPTWSSSDLKRPKIPFSICSFSIKKKCLLPLFSSRFIGIPLTEKLFCVSVALEALRFHFSEIITENFKVKGISVTRKERKWDSESDKLRDARHWERGGGCTDK